MPKPNTQAAPKNDADVMDESSHPFNGQDPDNPLEGVDPDTGTKAPKAGEKKTVKVNVGGVDHELDENVAAIVGALKKQNEDLYGYLRTMTQGTQGKPAPKADDKDEDDEFETLLFTDPKAAVKKIRASIKAEVKQEMTGQYNAVESEKQFWTAFYDNNKDLKEHDFYVRAVLNREFAGWKDLPAVEAAQKLAETVKKELLKMRGGRSDSDATSRGVEGTSSRVNAKTSSQNPEDVVPSIGEIIRKRQAARRQATFHKE